MLNVRRGKFYCRWGKRAFDFGLSLAGLLLLAAPLAVIWIVILLLDGPPILFRQQRVGRHGRLFIIYKFRTMRNRATSDSCISLAGDSRTTRVGRWLRRFKLDELPQLWNVLRGDMSFVGPRPDIPGYLDRLEGEAKSLWELRPGITGPASLLFRQEEEMLALIDDYVRFNDEVVYPEKVRLNLIYMRRCSFCLDLAYLLATIAPAVTHLFGLSRGLGLDYEAFESKMRDSAQRYSVS